VLADCAHHSDALASVATKWVLDGLIFRSPRLSVSQPKIERRFVKVHERYSSGDHLRQLHAERFDSAAALS
jgi:hypothetical protein